MLILLIRYAFGQQFTHWELRPFIKAPNQQSKDLGNFLFYKEAPLPSQRVQWSWRCGKAFSLKGSLANVGFVTLALQKHMKEWGGAGDMTLEPESSQWAPEGGRVVQGWWAHTEEHRRPQWWAEKVMCTLSLTCGPMWQSHTPAQACFRERQRSPFTAHAQPLLNQIMNQAISFTLKRLLGMVGLVNTRANIATHRCEEAWLPLRRKESKNGGRELKKKLPLKKKCVIID